MHRLGPIPATLLTCAALVGCAAGDEVPLAKMGAAPRASVDIDASGGVAPREDLGVDRSDLEPGTTLDAAADAAVVVDAQPTRQDAAQPADATAPSAVDAALLPEDVAPPGQDAAPDAAPIEKDAAPPPPDAAPDAAPPAPDAAPPEPDAEPPRLDAAPPPPPVLLKINEIDYDQDSTDNDEFIELYNAGDTALPLGGLSLELVNGATGETYGRVSLAEAGDLPPGGFLVLGGAGPLAIAQQRGARVLSLPGGEQNAVQNGPADGVRIVDARGGFIDGLAYEGELAQVGEGVSPEGRDDGEAVAGALGRCPDGRDSDRNSMDFEMMAPTPGAPNACD